MSQPPNYTIQEREGQWCLLENGQPIAICLSEIIALWLADLARQQRQVIVLGQERPQLILRYPQARAN